MTQQWRITRPGNDHFAPFYAGYVAAVPGGDLLDNMSHQLSGLLNTWAAVPAGKADYRYADGKWSIKEVINHVIDAERIFSYRALRAARGDETPLAGFEENSYAKAARSERRGMNDLAAEFEHLRSANLALFASWTDEEAGRRVVASNNPISAHALMYIVAGHAQHHDRVMKERYL